MTSTPSDSPFNGRGILLTTILGSGLAMMDGAIINVALPRLGDSLDASVADLQWVVNGYLLTLASLVLVGGVLGDRLGRKRIYLLGVTWFTIASVLCALAQEPWQLIAARLLQGIGGALLTPGSLAIIQASFPAAQRGKAIGTWSGMTGIAMAVGPIVGGWIIDVASWRWIFWLNLPLALVVLLTGRRCIPESKDPDARPFDIPGALLCTLSLASITYALIGRSWVLGLVGVLLMVVFVATQRRPGAMMPLTLFGSRVFSIANAMTLLVYGALGAMGWFLVLQLQISLGYDALQAGLATIPTTILMLLLAGKGGELGQRIGPRIPMTLGPIMCGVGVVLLAPLKAGDSYWLHVLPGQVVFGLGLCLLVAPLTTTVLAAAPDHLTGLASGVNNAVARTGSLLAVAALPALVGLSGTDYRLPAVFTDGYRLAQLICAGLLIAGGLISWFGLSARRSPSSRRAAGRSLL